jgi:hypothetical protein
MDSAAPFTGLFTQASAIDGLGGIVELRDPLQSIVNLFPSMMLPLILDVASG